MMRGETILCIAPRLWDSLWRESQQIMSRIAEQNRVLYFEPGRDYDRPHLPEVRRNLANFFALRTRKLHDNLIVIPTPSTLPTARRHLPASVLRVTIPFVEKVNAKTLIRQVRWAMEKFEVREPILWLNEPRSELVGEFGEKLSCYYNYDEFADFANNSHIKELVRGIDDRTTSQVDVVFATSQAQWRRRKDINSDTHFIPNGVDFNTFNRALDKDLPLPTDIALVPRPIIGFAGWLGHHIDVGLLCRVAETYPGCSLVLAGPDALPDSEARQRLRSLPNVFFLGRKEPRDLPNYLQTFDVALIPWAMSGHVLSAYPLKLHEYLAAGRAVVTVAMPELEPFRHVVRVSRSQNEFIKNVREALQDNGQQAVEARVAVARKNTWDHRVAKICRILDERLSVKKQKGQAGQLPHPNTSG